MCICMGDESGSWLCMGDATCSCICMGREAGWKGWSRGGAAGWAGVMEQAAFCA